MQKINRIIFVIAILIVIGYICYSNYYLKPVNIIRVNTYKSTYKNDNSNSSLRIKVITYNIHHGVGIDGELDLDKIIRVLRDSKADVIGLNEVDIRMRRSKFRNQIKYIAGKLEMNYAFGSSLKTLLGGYGNAILSKYPIRDAHNYLLPGKNNLEENRSFLQTKIEISDRFIYFLTTHLSLDKQTRDNQIEWINNYVQEIGQPYLLMGDFNSEDIKLNSKPVINDIKTYPSTKPEKEIDKFYSSTDLEVIDSYTMISEASDHLPLFIELELYL